MKDKNFLIVRRGFEPYETEGICEYLQDMAQQGWLLRNIKDGFVFEKAAPQKLWYSAVYLPHGSIYDKVFNPLNAAYADLCVEAGWYYVCNIGQLYFFVTALQNPIPIETDEGAKLQAIIRQNKKNNTLNMVLYGIMAFNFLQLILFDFRFIILDTIYIFLYTALFILFLFTVQRGFSFHSWAKKQKQRLVNGLAIEYPSRAQHEKKHLRRLKIILFNAMLFFSIAIILYFFKFYWDAAFFAVTMVFLLYVYLYNKHSVRKKSNNRFALSATIIIIIIFSMVICIGKGFYGSAGQKHILKSFLATEVILEYPTINENFSLTLFSSPYTAIKNHYCWSEQVFRNSENIPAPSKEVQKAFKSGGTCYLVYPNYVLSFPCEPKLTEKQLAAVCAYAKEKGKP